MKSLIQFAALRGCMSCINEKGFLNACAGKLKAVSVTDDKTGVLFTIRCDFPDMNGNNEQLTKQLLDQLMIEDRPHLIVLQR